MTPKRRLFIDQYALPPSRFTCVGLADVQLSALAPTAAAFTGRAVSGATITRTGSAGVLLTTTSDTAK